MSRNFNPDKEKFLYNLIRKKNKKIYEQFADEIIGLYLENGPGYAINNPTFQRHKNLFLNSKNMAVVKKILLKNPILRK